MERTIELRIGIDPNTKEICIDSYENENGFSCGVVGAMRMDKDEGAIREAVADEITSWISLMLDEMEDEQDEA